MGPPDGVASLSARWPKPASSVTAAGRCCGVDTLMAERRASSFAGICSGRSCAEGSCWRSSRTRCAYCSSITCMRLSSSRMPRSSVVMTTQHGAALDLARASTGLQLSQQPPHPAPVPCRVSAAGESSARAPGWKAGTTVRKDTYRPKQGRKEHSLVRNSARNNAQCGVRFRRYD